MGFRLPRNFNLPYRAVSPTDFWKRWHISLSTWLRDYLYISLGGNRKGTGRTYLNLFVTMLLGGLWHGANWTFVLWGAWHGCALIVDGATAGRPRLPKLIERSMTLLVVVFGWVMFRAETLAQAASIYRGMLGLDGINVPFVSVHAGALAFLALALILSIATDTADHRVPMRGSFAFGLAVLFVVCLARISSPSPFLYFQF